jgi:hypothetical protein
MYYQGEIAANSLSPYAWSVRGHRTTKGWAFGCWYPQAVEIILNNPHDIFALDNPDDPSYSPAQAIEARKIYAKNFVHMLYEAYTDPLWGKGKDIALFDDVAWRAAALYAFNEGMGLCANWQITDDVDSFIQSICDHAGCGIYQSINTGLITIKLFRDDYDPNAVRVYGPGTGLLSIDEIDESSLSEAVSEIIVAWHDPVTNQDRSTRQQNLGLLQAAPIISKSVSYPYIPTVELANRVASRDLRAQGLGVRKYQVTLDRSAAKLEPGMVIGISSPAYGIVKDILRIINIDYGSNNDGSVKVTATQDVFGLPSTTYALPQGASWTPPPTQPAVISDYALFEQNYRDLVLAQGQPSVDALPAGAGFISTVAVSPNGACNYYLVSSKLPGETIFTVSKDQGPFAQRGIVSSAVNTRQPVDVTLGNIDLTKISVGSLALWDSELVVVEVINGQTVTLGRGCVDTVAALHAAGSYLWFYDGQTGDVDRSFNAGDNVALQLIAYAGTTGVDPSLAGVHNFTVTGRINAPFPPRQVAIADRPFGEGQSATSGETLTWASSNRITQASIVYADDAAGIDPEPNTTWSVRITDGSNNVVLEQLNTTDMSVELPQVTGADNWTIELWATRDSIDSVQKHVFVVPYSDDLRITSTDDNRVIDNGSPRSVG